MRPGSTAPLAGYYSARCLAGWLLVLSLAGCQPHEGRQSKFAATLPPLGAVVEPVAGQLIDVLTPAGASPHTHEPRPSDARRAAAAAVLFFGSVDLDGWAASLDTGARVALLGLVPDSLQRPAFGVDGVDPHFWMDPLTVQAMLPAVADTLCHFEGEHCGRFRENAAAFGSELSVVHDSIAALLAPVRGASVILAHSFLQYFAHRYGIHVAGVIEEMAGSEPTPRDMQRIVETVRRSSARAVLTLPQHSSRAARAVAEAANIPLVEVDPIGGADDLPNLLYLNARTIRDALLDEPPPT